MRFVAVMAAREMRASWKRLVFFFICIAVGVGAIVALRSAIQSVRHYPAQLSGGQQQRIAVARAIAGGPSILLADEPTGNLDSRNGEQVMELLRDLHRTGTTICMVTHDPRYALYAERTVHMFDGQIVRDDTEAKSRGPRDPVGVS